MQKKKTELLIQKAKRQDPDAFTELMQFYMQDMYKVALAILMNDEPAATDEYHLEFREALATLTDRYRLIMALYYGEDYSVKEISALLKLPESTIRTRLQQGREQLASYYTNQ